MAIKIRCDECGAALKLPDAARGKAIKCPKCSQRIRVGGQAAATASQSGRGASGGASRKRRRPRSEEPHDSEEFLAGMDLSRAEDHETRVCAKCGAVVDEEEIECPKCGADPDTGGAGKTQRLRAQRGGYEPEVYYRNAFSDALQFVQKNPFLPVKASLTYLIFGTIAFCCALMVVWCVATPLKLFWGFFGLVAFLIPPGWSWGMQIIVDQQTIAKKVKLKKPRVDMFQAASNGVILYAWSFVVALPIAVLGYGLGLIMFMFGETDVALIGFCTAGAAQLAAAFFAWPAGLAHMSMPQAFPGWLPLKLYPAILRLFGPHLYCLGLSALALAPGVGLFAGAAAFSYPSLSQLVADFEHNAEIIRRKRGEASSDDSNSNAAPAAAGDNEPREISLTPLIIPAAVVVPFAFLFGYGSIFATRLCGYYAKQFKKQLDLQAMEKEVKYVAKEQKDPNAPEENQLETWPGVLAASGVMLMIGIAFGLVGSVFKDDISFVMGIGLGMFWIYRIEQLFYLTPMWIRMGWNVHPGWGIGLGLAQLPWAILAFSAGWMPLAFLIGIPFGVISLIVTTIFVVIKWDEAKYLFVLNALGVLILTAGLTIAITTGIVEVFGELEQAAAEAEAEIDSGAEPGVIPPGVDPNVPVDDAADGATP
ncbi:hypothetical protein [Stratiformator vulcanicus]|uniref:Double zinc ribbon n=1 Tax=Stratiformator vulcanicus TaxID=2527980 RepID=A0A517R6D8_9PLAN|nr:hypothetical protein [Stratiformator vulcanicus]QDT39439.1 Double zinc ribbon [Stratiformator vulcanicus]